MRQKNCPKSKWPSQLHLSQTLSGTYWARIIQEEGADLNRRGIPNEHHYEELKEKLLGRIDFRRHSTLYFRVLCDMLSRRETSRLFFNYDTVHEEMHTWMDLYKESQQDEKRSTRMTWAPDGKLPEISAGSEMMTLLYVMCRTPRSVRDAVDLDADWKSRPTEGGPSYLRFTRLAKAKDPLFKEGPLSASMSYPVFVPGEPSAFYLYHKATADLGNKHSNVQSEPKSNVFKKTRRRR